MIIRDVDRAERLLGSRGRPLSPARLVPPYAVHYAATSRLPTYQVPHLQFILSSINSRWTTQMYGLYPTSPQSQLSRHCITMLWDMELY